MVDTGFWIFGKKRMIPAGVVRAIDVDEKKVFVAMTKDEIKGAPDYDDDTTARRARLPRRGRQVLRPVGRNAADGGRRQRRA